MATVIERRAYLMLLQLHPRGFRREFGGEMLRVFEEASGTYGAGWLLTDAAISLVRQRLLRWPEESALTTATEVPMGLLAGTYPARSAPHLTTAKLLSAFCLSVVFFSLIDPVVMTAMYGAYSNRTVSLRTGPLGVGHGLASYGGRRIKGSSAR